MKKDFFGILFYFSIKHALKSHLHIVAWYGTEFVFCFIQKEDAPENDFDHDNKKVGNIMHDFQFSTSQVIKS